LTIFFKGITEMVFISCFFVVKLSDGVILEEAMPDQVRLHHVIFPEKVVLSAIARTNDALLT